MGYYLVQTLMEHGHEPTIIEVQKSSCKKLANELDIPIICGDGTTIEALETANTSEMDAILAVTGNDEANLISCQLAKKVHHVKKSVSRVNNPKNVEVMRQLGVDIAVSSTDNLARLLEREVDSRLIKGLLTLNRGEDSISEIIIPDNYILHGVKLSELEISEDFVFICITRGTKTIVARGNTQILSNDKILVMTQNSSWHKIKAILKLDQS